MWTGTAFDCQSANNQIILFPNRFQNGSAGVQEKCNGGAIVAHQLRVDSNMNTTTYTSQLDVKLNSNIVGKNITCLFDEDTLSTIIGSIILIQNGKF